jgi:hypothetical protein
LRADVAFADLSLLLIRMARPLPGPFPAALEAALAHRHLDILLDGLGMPHARAGAALQGPALSLEDLRALAPPRRRDGGGESTPDA